MNHLSTWISPEQAESALRHGTGRGVKVAILDSGVDLTHPALRHLRLAHDLVLEPAADGRLIRRAGKGTDAEGHGTAVAAVLHETAPHAILGSIRVLGPQLKGSLAVIGEAARLALDLGYHILNCSFGTPATDAALIRFKPWVDEAYRRGAHIVAACSNQDVGLPDLPGHFPSVISVNMARSDGAAQLFFRPSAAPHLVEFASRGVEVRLPFPGGSFRSRTGSSFAVPVASGLLARLLSRHPGLKPPVAKALLQEAAAAWRPSLAGPNCLR